MIDHTSRLKSFDLESMSDCTPHASGVQAFVENVISDYGIEDLWRLAVGNPEPGGVDNPSNAPENSTSLWTSYFTGRVSIL